MYSHAVQSAVVLYLSLLLYLIYNSYHSINSLVCKCHNQILIMEGLTYVWGSLLKVALLNHLQKSRKAEEQEDS